MRRHELAAWLHIDEHGKVTVYTGKTEIGQNIRTSLAQAVADELRVPLEADHDGDGRHRSRSLRPGHVRIAEHAAHEPRSSRRAAATAREMLIDLAAARAGRSIARRSARRDGRIVAGDGRGVTYGELTKGQKLTGGVTAQTALDTGRAVDAARSRPEESQRPRLRDRRPSVHSRHHPPRDALRSRRAARSDRRHARVG